MKRVMKTKKKSRDEQKTGAQRMMEDAEKMDRFFIEEVMVMRAVEAVEL